MSNVVAVHLKIKCFLSMYIYLNTDRYYIQFKCLLEQFLISMETVVGFHGQFLRADTSRYSSCPVGGASHPLKHRHRPNTPLASFLKKQENNKNMFT